MSEENTNEDVTEDPALAEQKAQIKAMISDDFDPDKSAAAGSEKKTSTQEDDDEDIDTSQLLAELLYGAFSVVAQRKGEHWMLTEKEAINLGKKSQRVLDKYIPSMKSGPEIALLAAALVIVGPRVAIDVKNARIIEGTVEQPDGDQPESRAA